MQPADDEAPPARGCRVLSLLARATGDSTLKGLIVTADDFGLAPEINAAVEAAHTNGILTAASLMVGAPASDDAVRRAYRMPSLRVGLHLVLVEGRPLLPPHRIPDLVDQRGLFRDNLVRLGIDIFFRSAVQRQVRAEVIAQFQAFAKTGLACDHVNAHKHFHLHPTIAKIVTQTALHFGVRSMRVPAEPSAVLKKIEPKSQSVALQLIAPLAAFLKTQAGRSEMTAAARTFGLAWSGAMTTDRLTGLLRNMQDGVTEIYMHPALSANFSAAAPGYCYAEEFAALTAPIVIAAARASGARFGGFSDFASDAIRS